MLRIPTSASRALSNSSISLCAMRRECTRRRSCIPRRRLDAALTSALIVVIDENVEIGDHAVLLAHVVIYRGVKIGDNFFAHAHAVVRENCRIGNNVLLQNGVVIGADGFGFAKTHDGRWHKIPQPAPVVIEDDVEVQANSCIDRASVGETRIRRGVKIDNLVQVGHGSQVGEDALLCSQVGLAGSTEIGKRVILDWTSRSRRTLQSRGSRDRHAAKRRGERHCRRRVGQRRACRRSQAMAEVFRAPAEIARTCPRASCEDSEGVKREIILARISTLCAGRGLFLKLFRQPALDCYSYFLHQTFAAAENFRLDRG